MAMYQLLFFIVSMNAFGPVLWLLFGILTVFVVHEQHKRLHTPKFGIASALCTVMCCPCCGFVAIFFFVDETTYKKRGKRIYVGEAVSTRSSKSSEAGEATERAGHVTTKEFAERLFKAGVDDH